MMFLLRSANRRDLHGVLQLAKLLDSYNLADDKNYIRSLLHVSEASFAGDLSKEESRYLFVLEDTQRKEIIGSSLILAKHGTRESPHLYLDVFTERRTSRTLGKTVTHRCLKFGRETDGPTEVGGLVLKPHYRRHRHRHGLQLSWVRFLYMALHPARFQRRVLVEFLPPLRPGKGGGNPFWDALGARFLGLPYHEADHLSIANKEFILSLFPKEKIYCDLLPKEVLSSFGQVGPHGIHACHALQRIGFRYLNQVEPFDGGPYYGATVDQIQVIRKACKGRVAIGKEGSQKVLVLAEREGLIRAAVVGVQRRGKELIFSTDLAKPLKLSDGDTVIYVPFP